MNALAPWIKSSMRLKGTLKHQRVATEANTTRIRWHITQQRVPFLSTSANPGLKGGTGIENAF